MTAVETILTEIAETEAQLDKARKARKATTPIKVRLASLTEALEAAQKAVDEVTPPAPVVPKSDKPKGKPGRPHKYAQVHYEVKSSLSRGKRGRPSRDTLIKDIETLREQDPAFQTFGSQVDPSTMSYADLAKLSKSLRSRALNKSKVLA